MHSNYPQGPGHYDGGLSPKENDSIYYWLPETNEPPLYPHKDAILISRDLLKRTYFEAFNFYFSKPINEILANLSLPHVILYKDYLYYDDESEYLKRYYRLDESFPRVQNLSKFYSNTSEGLAKPNLAVHEQNKIILKRNNKLHKYYLNKLQNFADIPQTQRNPHADDDFRILNNLHDDEGYSEDLYAHQHRQRHTNEERYADSQPHHENEGGVHNSFQQMLERYEEATAKVSFESNEHDMYDPQDSTGSPKAGNKSEAEENITFDDKSIEFSSKLHEKDFLLERQAFMNSRHSELTEEKIHDVHRENEDQIPHNLSNFALSDASDLHIINDMIRSTIDDNLTGTLTLTNNFFKEPVVHTHIEKVKPHARDRQKENEEVEKEKNKAALLHAQKSHSTKSKSTSTHVSVKQSEAAPKKLKVPLEKGKTLKEPDSAPVHTEKPLKSIERNVYPKDQHTEKAGIQAFVSSKREKEEVILDKSQRSTRNADVLDKMSPRDLQYPALSMKNVPINQIKAVENGKKHTEIKVTATPYDDKNFFNKNRKSAPQAGKKSSGSYKKLSIPGESKATEKSSNPINSAQYIQSLMEKYQKGLEEGANRSKESSKDNYTGIKTKVSGDDLGDKAPKSSELYSNTDFYAKVAKKAEPKTHHLSRSKTDDTLLKDLYQNKPKTLLKASPTKVTSHQPASARTIALSPTNPRKDKLGHRFGSNEGLSPRLFNTSTNKLLTQLSSENCKSLAENLPEDRFYSTSGNGNYKSVKIEKIFAYKRTEMKPPMKNSAQKSEASNNLSTNMRRLTAAHTYSGASSVEKNDLNSVPVSPTKKFDLKLNLNRLNQMPGRHQKESSTENSYGFWTSRSARLGPDEESKHLKQSGGAVEDKYKNDSSKKEYLLKKNYEPYLDTKKKTKTTKKGGSFTNRGPTHGLKAREGEVSRNPTLLKSAAHESDLHHMYTDLHEVNSAGRANILRNSDTRLDLNSARNDSNRQGKK